MRDRRALGRVPLQRIMKPMPATFEADEVRAQGQVLNVSSSGLFVSTECPPEPGKRVLVVFEDATGGKIEAEGTVRWSDAHGKDSVPGFGMEIDHPSDDFSELYEELRSLLARRPVPGHK